MELRGIEAVRKRKMSEEVVDRLTRMILSRELKPGEKLPPERDLCTRFKVNRSTLREALRSLEAQGLIRVRQGSGVTIGDFLEDANFTFLEKIVLSEGAADASILASLHEFRVIAQRQIVLLAAERADDADMARLEAIVGQERQETDPVLFRQLDWDFFHTIARATKNVTFVFLLNSVKHLHERWGALFFSVPGTIEQVRRFHNLLARAIRRRDGAKAANIMDKLLEYSNPILLERFGKS